MSISNVDSKSEWLDSLFSVLTDVEAAEKELSYVSHCGTEHARKLSGSYYTPIDVARFFWNEFFVHNDITSANNAAVFLKSHTFVEPSVGAGALFFALLERLLKAGVTPLDMSKIEVDLVDINQHALTFIRTKVTQLENAFRIKFHNLRFISADFRELEYGSHARPVVFFGNPPFVANEKATSNWKNIFADFVEICLNEGGASGSIHFILPISVAFSRDYWRLREMLRSKSRKIVLSHFDNIPDTLFKSGKPLHDNSNKANSQRCSILTALPHRSPVVLSTKLHRWSKRDRESVLGQSPEYFNVTCYEFDDQFPRPENVQILSYLVDAGNAPTLGDTLSQNGRYSLCVGSVARNYIGIREEIGSGIHQLGFDRKSDFYFALGLLSSDLFKDYWLTVGDGFHVTKSNILDFPVLPRVAEALAKNQRKMAHIWSKRSEFAKLKLNSGKSTSSYDFSQVAPSLYRALS